MRFTISRPCSVLEQNSYIARQIEKLLATEKEIQEACRLNNPQSKVRCILAGSFQEGFFICHLASQNTGYGGIDVDEMIELADLPSSSNSSVVTCHGEEAYCHIKGRELQTHQCLHSGHDMKDLLTKMETLIQLSLNKRQWRVVFRYLWTTMAKGILRYPAFSSQILARFFQNIFRVT